MKIAVFMRPILSECNHITKLVNTSYFKPFGAFFLPTATMLFPRQKVT